jgi:Ca2+-dependent lipid-binding protein
LLIELPGSSKLRLQVIDYDSLFSDDLIGETSIDIEDRYFDNRWQALESKPIEVRQLYHPDYEVSQGEVLMWIEMFDQGEDIKLEPWNIEPEPKSTLEMRLIVFETEGMENLDIEDTSDIYVMAYVDGNKKFQTDVHYRCSTGQGSFNWRMLIPIEFPRNKFDLTLQTYDCDILSRDDFICGARLNLSQILYDVNVLDIPLKLSSEYYSNLPQEKKFLSNIEFASKDEDEEGVKFWIQMEKDGKKGGRVLCSIEIVPQWYADLHPVGKGRDEPNMNPYLPPPVGRISFTLNPFKMFNQLTGPKFRKKCYWICFSISCTIYLIFMVPYVVYFISGEVFNPFK